MQVIVTSYGRLAYMKRTVESLRQDPVQIYIVDGGSDTETVEWIKANADGWLLFDNNPGADFLKTEGIKEFATDPEFLLTSEDLLFPKGYSARIMSNYRKVNARYPKIDYTFCACQMPHQKIGAGAWKNIHGVECAPCVTSQVSGAIIDRKIIEKIGYFPNYGKTGTGDRAVNVRLQKLGIRRCYWKDPSLLHIGAAKATDYPDLDRLYKEVKPKYIPHAVADDGRTLAPSNTYRIVGRR